MLIEERRPAGTRLLPSLLDIWSSHVTWTGKEKLRSWLVRTLRQGHFLLESNRPSFSARVYGQPKIDAAARAEAFYADSVTELLDVLGDKTGSSAIPDGAIVFCHAVYDALRLSPANQNGLSSFVLTRWLFASFMPDLLVSPESYGLLIDHHISDLARQRICHEIALRARKVVSDVYYDRPFAPSVATETRTLVHRVAARLQFATSTTLGRLATPPAIEGASGTTFVNICAADALAIMKVLYPPSEVGNAVTDSTGVRSSASSMSGFSLFRATDFTEQQWTATPYNIPGAEDFPTLFSSDERALDLNGTDVGSPARSSDLLTVLLDRTDTRRAACEAASDFVGAHRWMEYADMIDSYDTSDGRIALLNNIAAILRDAESDVDYVLASLKQYEMWEITTATLLSATLRSMVPPTKLCAQLRTKMWYHADVRTTGVYDNLRSVANALRAMYKSAKLAGPILPGTIPTRGVASPNLVASAGQWKSESMVLDLLGVAAAHGGPNKLNDMHVKQVQAWRQRSQIHSVCEGEERIHKFCMEVRKCVDHFTTIGTLEDTVQQSARSSTQQQHYSYVLKPDTGNDPHAYLRHRANSLTLQTQVAPSIDSISTASHTLSNASSREYFDGRSPTLTSKSSATFWSPTLSEAQSPSSATSVGSYAPPVNIEKKFSKEITDTTDLASLKRDFTGLLLSEIGDVLFAHGSETDQAFWDGVGGELTQSHLSGARTSLQEQLKSLHASRTLRHASQRQPFDYYGAIRQLFKLFGSADDPHSKLWYLGRVQELLIPFMAPPMQDRKSAHENTETSATPSQASPPLGRYNPDGDAAIEGFYLLFAEPTLRPAFLFRDLQYIASLLPSSVLESQPDGKSFWNAVAAVTRIKNEMCKIYIETADTIIDFHTKARGHSRSSSQAQQQRDDASFPSPSRTPPLDSGTKYTMSDAAHLLQIAAKEGLPVAQCELATLYLTHPDLMERVLAPWALPKEVFREEIEGRSKREKDLDRYDPGTMCVAIHWMVKAAEGGDALAKAHLRQREEMEKLG
ncbi:hypothetical protein B0A48_00671 [Cryoendolithus antarcticus]|uniref:Uncharacterized protein n=1 Tax=Cryoendolithus antarcticus TaxID=1507870 RepID=A0A1V8TVA0_9PEZI|nr:hypothetical protein B0A48_00671 [Cryoendolithus antarcticus]